MNLYYYNGEVLKAVYDRAIFNTKISPDLTAFYIDEVADNKELCVQLAASARLTNVAGETRFYVQAGELYERDGWEQQSPEGF